MKMHSLSNDGMKGINDVNEDQCRILSIERLAVYGDE